MNKNSKPSINQQVKSKSNIDIGPVVSAEHLASGAMPSLSEIEFALNIANNAYQRWMMQAATASGFGGLAANDILVLHQINHRDREKTLADLCLVLNIEDTHLVNYSIKKLAGIGLIKTGKRGKEKTATITPSGRTACQRYRDIREALLVKSVKSLGLDEARLSDIAAVLRSLSGQYEQASRSAASL